MKQIVLAAMVMMTVAGSASAANDWDTFWGTTVPGAFVELGSTLDPVNSGWNDFWYQCQDPDKGFGDCVGTVATGIGAAIVLPLLAAGIVVTAGAAIIGGLPAVVVTTPVAGMYISAAGVIGPVPAGGTITGLLEVVKDAAGMWILA